LPISIQDVRETLANVTSQQVGDGMIRQAIRLARTKINLIKRDNISITDVESAQLMYAAYLAFQFELTGLVRKLGSAPLEAQQALTMLRLTAEEYINEIRWTKKGLPVIGSTEGADMENGQDVEL